MSLKSLLNLFMLGLIIFSLAAVSAADSTGAPTPPPHRYISYGALKAGQGPLNTAHPPNPNYQPGDAQQANHRLQAPPRRVMVQESKGQMDNIVSGAYPTGVASPSAHRYISYGALKADQGPMNTAHPPNPNYQPDGAQQYNQRLQAPPRRVMVQERKGKIDHDVINRACKAYTPPELDTPGWHCTSTLSFMPTYMKIDMKTTVLYILQMCIDIAIRSSYDLPPETYINAQVESQLFEIRKLCGAESYTEAEYDIIHAIYHFVHNNSYSDALASVNTVIARLGKCKAIIAKQLNAVDDKVKEETRKIEEKTTNLLEIMLNAAVTLLTELENKSK